MTNVLHIINSLVTGGAEMLLKDTVTEFINNKYPYRHFVLPLLDLGELNNTFPEEAVILSDITKEKNILSKYFKIKAFIKENNIKVVHAHLYESCIFSRFLKNKNLKIINSYHTGFHDPKSIEFGKKRLFLDKLTKEKCDLYVFVSKAVQDQIVPNLGIETKKQIILPNFANSRFYFSNNFDPSPRLKLIAIGNLRVQKNYQLLLNALVKTKGLPIAVDVYGEGTLRDELQNFIDENEISCELKGRAFVTSELLSNYDAFIMTSFHEGMPISLIEAMSAGLPSVLNDLPELRETARNSAIYFEKNSIESLATTLNNLLKDKQQLKTLSSNINTFISTYKVGNYLNVLDQEYKS